MYSDTIKSDIIIRSAAVEDAAAIQEIYAPYVTDTAITFEYEIPSVEEMAQRIEETLKKYPYLVACRQGEVVGYAYVSAFHPRAAYSWSTETSIYIRKDCRRSGLGNLLYERIFAILKDMNILNVNACIAYPNPGSIAFHEKLGFETVAHFHKCGYKLGKWYDMIWMEKMLGEHENPPRAVKFHVDD